MKKIFLTAIAAVALFGLSPALRAQTSITFVTPANSESDKLPVDASATFTVSAGKIVITLTNLEPNTVSQEQLITDLAFKLSGPVGYINSFSSSSQDVTIKSNGSYTLGRTGVSSGWGYGEFGNGLVVCVVCPEGMKPGPQGEGIIGPGPYHSGNGGIDSSHNPFLYETATFTIYDKNITPGTTVTSAVFSFGTDFDLDLVNGVPKGMPTTPEPQSMLLFGTGLLVVGGLLRRRLVSAS
jgi:hypothetical protein